MYSDLHRQCKLRLHTVMWSPPGSRLSCLSPYSQTLFFVTTPLLMSTPVNNAFDLAKLPLDLLEYIGLFFNSHEAFHLLTVSSGIHNVFARSVWRVVNTKTLMYAYEEIRDAAYAKYGHLVRKIDLAFDSTMLMGQAFSWVQLFPNVTTLEVHAHEDLRTQQANRLVEAVTELHDLRLLKLRMASVSQPLDLDAIASAIISRNGDKSKQRLQRLTIYFSDTQVDDSWTRVASCVRNIKSHVQCDIEVSLFLKVSSTPPTPDQVALLSPLLTGVTIYHMANDNICWAQRNRQMLCPLGTSTNITFPKLETLYLMVCCSSASIYDYADVTLAKFPRLQRVRISSDRCSNTVAVNETDPVTRWILTRSWPHLNDIWIPYPLDVILFKDMLAHQPHLLSLEIKISKDLADDHGRFKLEQILDKLPRLHTLHIGSVDSTVILCTNWTIKDDYIKHIQDCRLRTLSFSSVRLSVNVMELFFLLPKLNYIGFNECGIEDREAVLSMLKRVQQSNPMMYRHTIEYLSIFNLRTDNDWTAELVNVLIDTMSNLKKLKLYNAGGVMLFDVKQRHPHIKTF
ncbi:hypothetical protein GQ42DRAFT_79763 [Ramicandelaber brevisporus]|nr:hypothetical protein GQ42DRAFT_79763 [Ramicandelaber brevisporus]